MGPWRALVAVVFDAVSAATRMHGVYRRSLMDSTIQKVVCQVQTNQRMRCLCCRFGRFRQQLYLRGGKPKSLAPRNQSVRPSLALQPLMLLSIDAAARAVVIGARGAVRFFR